MATKYKITRKVAFNYFFCRHFYLLFHGLIPRCIVEENFKLLSCFKFDTSMKVHQH